MSKLNVVVYNVVKDGRVIHRVQGSDNEFALKHANQLAKKHGGKVETPVTELDQYFRF